MAEMDPPLTQEQLVTLRRRVEKSGPHWVERETALWLIDMELDRRIVKRKARALVGRLRTGEWFGGTEYEPCDWGYYGIGNYGATCWSRKVGWPLVWWLPVRIRARRAWRTIRA